MNGLYKHKLINIVAWITNIDNKGVEIYINTFFLHKS